MTQETSHATNARILAATHFEISEFLKLFSSLLERHLIGEGRQRSFSRLALCEIMTILVAHQIIGAPNLKHFYQKIDPIGNRTTCAILQARPTKETPMISHAKIYRHRRMFKTLTSLSTEGFKQILPSFEEAWEADLDRRDAGVVPGVGVEAAREGSGGPQTDSCSSWPISGSTPIQAVQGLLFGMSQPQANEWVHRLTPFLNAALGHQQQLPARQPRDLEAVLGECEGLEFIIDGVERSIQRPKNPER